MFDVWYWAILERNKDGRYFASVPDLPGATAAGGSEKEVLQNITAIAADYVRDLVEDGHDVPTARNSDEIERDPEADEYGRAAIPVDVPGKSVKISLSIDEALLKRIDRAANSVGMTRSGFFADCAQQRLSVYARETTVVERIPSKYPSSGSEQYYVPLVALTAAKESLRKEAIQIGSDKRIARDAKTGVLRSRRVKQ
jgi:predicted RNase H-like HicB family nuclease